MSQSLELLSTQVPGSTPDLMQWVSTQLAAGYAPHTLEKSLTDTGWSAAIAQAAVAICMRPITCPSPAIQGPGPNLQEHSNTIDVGDRQVQVLMSMHHPEVVLFDNLLSASECAQLIAQARPAMARSKTVATHSSAEEINPDRTSDGMFYARGQTPTVTLLEARIAQLLRWPLENGEGLQVLNYRPGAQYKPHHDYFNPQDPGSSTLLQRGGQRVGTLLIYLNDVPGGGCTFFPETQLRIHPRQGQALFFAYPSADMHSRTLHGGDPVTQGDKWIATKWLRERAFD